MKYSSSVFWGMFAGVLVGALVCVFYELPLTIEGHSIAQSGAPEGVFFFAIPIGWITSIVVAIYASKQKP